MVHPDYYELLGVSHDADAQTIKRAYRQRARQCHPDLHAGDGEAEEQFKALGQAYDALGDPERRRRYDALRPASSAGAARPSFNARAVWVQYMVDLFAGPDDPGGAPVGMPRFRDLS